MTDETPDPTEHAISDLAKRCAELERVVLDLQKRVAVLDEKPAVRAASAETRPFNLSDYRIQQV